MEETCTNPTEVLEEREMKKLIYELQTESDIYRNVGAYDMANLLDEAIVAIETLEAQNKELVEYAKELFECLDSIEGLSYIYSVHECAKEALALPLPAAMKGKWVMLWELE